MRDLFDPEARSIARRLRMFARVVLMCGLLIGVSLTVSGCGPDDDDAAAAQLTIAVLPDEAEEELRRRYAPLIAYLKQRLEMEVRLVIPRDYEDILVRFGVGEIDLAYFGGVTFVQASERYGAVPLVLRDIDLEFTTFYLSRAEEPLATVEGFRGRRFAFGSELSTSGHFMPRYFMQAQGLMPEEDFASVVYSGAHDRTVYWVRDGLVDLGAANSAVVRTMLNDGRLAPGELRIVEETPPYADYVWAVRANTREDLVTRLRNAFLALSPEEGKAREILASLRAGGFLPARHEDFAGLREVVLSMQKERLGRDENPDDRREPQ